MAVRPAQGGSQRVPQVLEGSSLACVLSRSGEMGSAGGTRVHPGAPLAGPAAPLPSQDAGSLLHLQRLMQESQELKGQMKQQEQDERQAVRLGLGAAAGLAVGWRNLWVRSQKRRVAGVAGASVKQQHGASKCNGEAGKGGASAGWELAAGRRPRRHHGHALFEPGTGENVPT